MMPTANADGPVYDAGAAGRCLNGGKCRCHQHRHRRVFQVGEEEGLDDASAADYDDDNADFAASAASVAALLLLLLLLLNAAAAFTWQGAMRHAAAFARLTGTK